MTRVLVSDLVAAEVDARPIYKSISECQSTTGSPTVAQVQGVLYETAPDSATTVWTCNNIVMPSSWNHYGVDVYCINPTTTAGNVRIQVRRNSINNGDTILSIEDEVGSAVAVSTVQHQVTVHTVATSRVAEAGIQSISFGRFGTNSTDTKTDEYGFLGFVLRKVD